MTPTVPASLTIPTRASAVARLRIGVEALTILRNEQANPFYARLLHLSFDREIYARLARRMRENPEQRRVLEERRTIPGDGWDLQALAKLPEGTLGHAYARYYADNGIEPFTFEFPLEDDVDVLNKRYRETHDIHHIVTGYGIDAVGEIEIQAFYYGNLGFRHAAFIMLTSMFVAECHGWKFWRHIGKLRAAYLRGKASPLILGIHFDEMWEQPVTDVAQLLRLVSSGRSKASR
jgi:ubiquinone biosynthesis protein COQ4